MSRTLGRLFAVLLAASSVASASMILTSPHEVLIRSVDKPDPTPLFGPKLQLIPGPRVQVYPPQPEQQNTASLAIIAVSLPVSIVLLLLIPVCQRLALAVRLLD